MKSGSSSIVGRLFSILIALISRPVIVHPPTYLCFGIVCQVLESRTLRFISISFVLSILILLRTERIIRPLNFTILYSCLFGKSCIHFKTDATRLFPFARAKSSYQCTFSQSVEFPHFSTTSTPSLPLFVSTAHSIFTAPHQRHHDQRLRLKQTPVQKSVAKICLNSSQVCFAKSLGVLARAEVAAAAEFEIEIWSHLTLKKLTLTVYQSSSA